MTAPDLAPTAPTDTNATPAFAVQSARDGLICHGIGTRLVGGSAATLGQRVAAFFATPTDGPDLLAGALPFDRAAPDHLFQPRAVRRSDTSVNHPAAIPQAAACSWRLLNGGAPGRYAAAVTRALRMLDDVTLRKVVLARSITLQADQAVTIDAVMQRLAANRDATAFSVQLPARDNARGPRHLVGASPELLIAKTGDQIRSCPLAGTAARRADHSEDQAAAQGLLRSDKDRREHRAVVEAVLDTLAPYCARLPARPEPILRKTAGLWHLGTPISGTLTRSDTSSAELAAALHPTPAVCGLPRTPAYAAIADLEACDRDFYAGAIGWTRANGDGEWHVAIRCAEIEAARVRLYAGAGIVAGSDPEQETRETTAKFAVMLKALGIDEKQLGAAV